MFVECICMGKLFIVILLIVVFEVFFVDKFFFF